jgi:hypothetical protein
MSLIGIILNSLFVGLNHYLGFLIVLSLFIQFFVFILFIRVSLMIARVLINLNSMYLLLYI